MEGKKSFVLYTDLMDIVNDLSDEQAGKLVKMIVNYVNDREPECEDQLIKIAFKPIKNSLKRDLQKWESIKQKRSEAGKMGGRPKKEDKPKKANALSEKQSEAKKAVSVNVSVNDNVNDSVINKENLPLTVEDAESKFETAGVKGRYFSTIGQIYNLNEKIIKEEFGKWKLSKKGETFNNEKHMRDSFNYWMRNYNPPRGSTEPVMNTLPVNNRKNRNPS